MKAIVDELHDYLAKVLGMDVVITSYGELRNQLAAYLANTHDFYRMKLGVHTLLLVYYLGEDIQTPSAVKNKLAAIREKTDLIPIHISLSMTRDARRDLIRLKVPFVVPNQQLYLPDLGIDFREWLVKQHSKPTKLTPKAQLTALASILDNESGLFGIGSLAGKFGYSLPTASRVASELEALGTIDRERRGKEQLCMWKGTSKERWELLMPYLSNPEIKLHHAIVSEDLRQTFALAGLSALCHYSRIGEPNIPVYACSNLTYLKMIKTGVIRLLEYPIESAFLLQVWSYDPNLLAREGYVDPLSLYLNLQDDPDDRTQFCLKEMLENLKW